MKISFFILIFFIFTGCSQKYYQNNNEISKEEYISYKNNCNKKYQEYLNQYNRGGIYAMSQKRHPNEFHRNCMRGIYQITLKKEAKSSFERKKSSEINLFKIEHNIIKISK